MMKHIYSSLLFTIIAFSLNAQVIVFFDDFESGITNWDVTGSWGTTTTIAYSPTHSFTDSPGADYLDATTSEATMNTGADLTTALDADVQFYAQIDLETGFDYVYLDVSADGGAWLNLATFNGEDLFSWELQTVALGAFVGYSDVRLRFRFVSDAAYFVDGIYIDDFTITTYNVDNTPPLVLHTPAHLYEGTLGENPLTAELIDPSGISETELFYRVDGGPYLSVTGSPTFGDEYLYTVPEQAPGSWVDYYITATDDYVTPNSTQTDTFSYVAGNYIVYDDPTIDFVADVGTLALTGYVSAAVKVTLAGTTDLVGIVIQNYTDYSRPNDDIRVHIWADDAGLPGTDLITSFYVTPSPTLEEPNKGTWIDLRGMPELEGITGDIYIGYDVPGGVAWLSYANTLLVNRSYVETGFGWASLTGDIHFRAITSEIAGAPAALFSYDDIAEPLIAFTDESTNFPTSWYWDFGDATSSTIENPVHNYLSNGSFNVCLTATNGVGSDTYCEAVEVDYYVAPDANFTFSGDPTVTFTDLSTNTPLTWDWDFGDGATSTIQDPVHTYTANGDYNVCLTASNAEGGSMECKSVTIGNTPQVPIADFTYTVSGLTVSFTDVSTYLPTSWNWSFGDGATSTLQNPSHAYSVYGNYTVCLTATNAIGSDDNCIVLGLTGIEELNTLDFAIYPNPATDYLMIESSIQLNSDAQWMIMNDLGDVVIEGNLSSYSIHISDLADGIYLLKISNEVEQGTSTFIKQ